MIRITNYVYLRASAMEILKPFYCKSSWDNYSSSARGIMNISLGNTLNAGMTETMIETSTEAGQTLTVLTSALTGMPPCRAPPPRCGTRSQAFRMKPHRQTAALQKGSELFTAVCLSILPHVRTEAVPPWVDLSDSTVSQSWMSLSPNTDRLCFTSQPYLFC